MKYEQLFTQDLRQDVLDIGDSLAKYVYDNNIQNIMLMDRSARPAYLTLKNSWKKHYSGTKCPNIYFTNPDCYDVDDKYLDNLSAEFNKVYARLAEDKTVPIMLFDVCMHTGSTLKPVIKTLKNAGYSNVIVGLAQPVGDAQAKYLSASIDFIAKKYRPAGGCYPFRRDDLILKPYASFLSIPNPSSNWGVIIRREMNAIFRGNVESDYYESPKESITTFY